MGSFHHYILISHMLRSSHMSWFILINMAVFFKVRERGECGRLPSPRVPTCLPAARCFNCPGSERSGCLTDMGTFITYR